MKLLRRILMNDERVQIEGFTPQITTEFDFDSIYCPHPQVLICYVDRNGQRKPEGGMRKGYVIFCKDGEISSYTSPIYMRETIYANAIARIKDGYVFSEDDSLFKIYPAEPVYTYVENMMKKEKIDYLSYGNKYFFEHANEIISHFLEGK